MSRVVVCSLGGTSEPWLLPASVPSDRARIHGGERSLYEFAVAAALAGHEVEVRGEIHRAELQAMAAAQGVEVLTGMPARAPAADDIVVVQEGWTDPIECARVTFSPARAILLLLGPPGMVGWDFVGEWTPRDPLSIDPTSVARAESFVAMAEMGFELLTNTLAFSEIADAAGIECVCIGTGRPTPWPPAADAKTYDIAVVGDNRWAATASRVAEEVVSGAPRTSVLRIPALPHEELVREIGKARVLVWTGLIEGTARPLNEARAVGTVPVSLSNPFMRGMDEHSGVVVVDDISNMADAVLSLLEDGARCSALATRGAEAVREFTDWDTYASRVAEALTRLRPPREGQAARSAVGEGLRRMHSDSVETRRRSERELEDARTRLTDLLNTRLLRYTAPLRKPYENFRRRRGLNRS